MRTLPISILLVLSMFISFSAHAASLTRVSDLVPTSAASASATHTITFTVTNALSPSGRILITPAAGAFTIPVGFDVQDVDLAVSSGSSFVERDLAASASATEDGIAVVSGSSGSVTITLNSTAGISAGETVRVLLGTNASYGGAGDTSIVNPAALGSYRIAIKTETSGGTRIDDGATHVSVVAPVGVGTLVNPTPPDRSNGLPSGAISHGNSVIEISLDTNEPGTCRYATTTAVAYGDMLGTFSYSGGTLHTTVISGHADGASYSYSVRCIDVDGVFNTDDYAISFSLNSTPSILVSTGTVGGGTSSNSGGGGGSGSGEFSGGSQNLYLASVALSGFTSPLGSVHILRDETEAAVVQSSASGAFSGTVSNLERGAYSLSVYVVDRAGRKTALYNSTLAVGQGTANVLSGILMSPTLSLSPEAVEPGEEVIVSGEGAPGRTVEVVVKPQGFAPLGGAKAYTTPIGAAGDSSPGEWSVSVPTAGFARGTYEVRASIVNEGVESNPASPVALLGIGEEPTADLAARSDINGDGAVNLVDFSIMLSFWGTPRDEADVNLDGTINLSDFSILLFNWTG